MESVSLSSVLERFKSESKQHVELSEWVHIRKTRTPENQERIMKWRGPEDVIHWILGDYGTFDGKARQVGYWELPRVPELNSLLSVSSRMHEVLLKPLGKECDHSQKDIVNVQDFHYCTSLIPNLRTVLDLGAGYARQAFLFGHHGIRYIATDSVEQAYMVQHWVLSELAQAGMFSYSEYFDQWNESQVQHLPTWKLGQIPDGTVDVVIASWVLSEMSERGAQNALHQIDRLLRDDGYVYIRDEPHNISYAWDADRRLRRMGYQLIYHPQKQRREEIHGTPRLYRKSAKKKGFVQSLFSLRSRFH